MRDHPAAASTVWAGQELNAAVRKTDSFLEDNRWPSLALFLTRSATAAVDRDLDGIGAGHGRDCLAVLA